MSRQYIRRCRLTVGKSSGIEIEELKIEFDIEKTLSSKQNTARFTVWNLKRENRFRVANEFEWVRFEAGYRDGGMGILFEGNIREVEHERERPDIKTVISCGDGDKAIRKGVISKVVGGSPKEQVQELLKHMPDVAQGELKGLDGPAYKRPVVMHGPVSRELDALSRTHGFYWSVQNGVLETIPADGFIDQVVELSEDSGLVGTPTMTENGVKAKALLNAQIAPGRLVRIVSPYLEETRSGSSGALYRVNKAHFSGDNIDGEFTVEIEGQKVENGRVTGEGDTGRS